MKLRLLQDHASRHVNGKTGDVLEVDEAHGRSLLAYKIAELVGDAAVAPAPPSAPPTKGTREGKGKSAAADES